MSNFRSIFTFVLTAVSFLGFAQDAFHNYGNTQIHDAGKVGFHIDVINDGEFNDNEGKVGFYSENSLTVSGDHNPVFYC